MKKVKTLKIYKIKKPNSIICYISSIRLVADCNNDWYLIPNFANYSSSKIKNLTFKLITYKAKGEEISNASYTFIPSGNNGLFFSYFDLIPTTKDIRNIYCVVTNATFDDYIVSENIKKVYSTAYSKSYKVKIFLVLLCSAAILIGLGVGLTFLLL